MQDIIMIMAVVIQCYCILHFSNDKLTPTKTLTLTRHVQPPLQKNKNKKSKLYDKLIYLRQCSDTLCSLCQKKVHLYM